MTGLCMEGRIGMDIGMKLLPVMWVHLCIPRHIHCSCRTVMAQGHTCCTYQCLSLFLVLILQSLYDPLQFKEFFIYMYLL